MMSSKKLVFEADILNNKYASCKITVSHAIQYPFGKKKQQKKTSKY